MNTVSRINQQGSKATLNPSGDYSLGIISPLGPFYNDTQGSINSQIFYTATQADITSMQGSAYLPTNLALENTATLLPTTLESQIAAINYVNASTEVNYANQVISNNANNAYTNANAVLKACEDSAYMAFITHQAAEIIADRVSTATVVVSIANTDPDISRNDIASLKYYSTIAGNVDKSARKDTSQAHINAMNQQNKLISILNTAILRSRTVTTNLVLTAAFNTLVKNVIKNLSDPLLLLSGNEDLITQYRISSLLDISRINEIRLPLNNAIAVAAIAIASLNNFIAAIKANVLSSSDITASVIASQSLAATLDADAKEKNLKMEVKNEALRITYESISTSKTYDSAITAHEGDSYTARYVTDLTKIASAAKYSDKLSMNATVSAANARVVSDSMVSLKQAFTETVTRESTILDVATTSLRTLTDVMAAVNKLTSCNSPHLAIDVSKRASNTVEGSLHRIIEGETTSLLAALDSKSILALLQKALITISLPNGITQTQNVVWAINKARAMAFEICEKTKKNAFILSRVAHTYVSPQRIATQTSAANNAGIASINTVSRLNRNSRNPPVDPPQPFNSFKANIRAKLFKPARPTLEELIYMNSPTPLRLDSIRTITETKVQVAKEAQRVKDISITSFRQQ